MCDRLKDCPLCGGEGWSRYEGESQLIFCHNEACALWGEYYTRIQWQKRPTEDRLKAERDATAEDLKKAGVQLTRARGWASVVIKKCDGLNIELPEFDNWGDLSETKQSGTE